MTNELLHDGWPVDEVKLRSSVGDARVEQWLADGTLTRGTSLAARIKNWNDAKLIAAAPDLLAACVALVDSLNNDLSDDQAAAWDAGRAAIAKAEGR